MTQVGDVDDVGAADGVEDCVDKVKVGDVNVEIGSSSLGKSFAGAFGKKCSIQNLDHCSGCKME